jgi:hypothetical protein
MTERLIFTVATGRCGQASLTDLVNDHVPGCYAAFEEPNIEPLLPRPLDRFERRFRRRFMETHELLGRGRVLAAFEAADHGFIDKIVERRMRTIRRQLRHTGASIYFDVSKFFARGLHVGFTKAVGGYALVNLVRDPLCNMRSFLNREKNFTLDNNLPSARSNLLQLDTSGWEAGEFYLWVWCELYLRYEAMRQSPGATHAIEIRTEDLQNPDIMSRAFNALNLEHTTMRPRPARNANRERGFSETKVSAADIRLFERFLDRLPGAARERISYLKGYDPWAIHQLDRAG